MIYEGIDEIIRLCDRDSYEKVASRLATSDPWITLGMSFEDCMEALVGDTKEFYAAMVKGKTAGIIVIEMGGAFKGYVQILFVDEAYRGSGIGSQLLAFAQERVFEETTNLFLCVSDFNKNAYDFYLKAGFERVGVLRDYLVKGRSEILLRKSVGPLLTFRRSKV